MTLQEIGRREHRHVGPPHGVSQVVISCSWGSSDGAVITPTDLLSVLEMSGVAQTVAYCRLGAGSIRPLFHVNPQSENRSL